MKIRRRYNKTPSRRRVPGVGADNKLARRTPLVPVFTGTGVTTETTVSFEMPTVYTGQLPGFTGSAHTVESVTQIDANTFNLVWTGTIADGSDIVVPFEDQAFRNQAGGYVLPGTYVVQDSPA